MAPRFHVTVLIPLELDSRILMTPIDLKIPSLQYEILMALKRRPCYIRLLEKLLGKAPGNIYRSARKLRERGLVKEVVYASRHGMGKAGLRRYYILSESVVMPCGCLQGHEHSSLEEVAEADDLRILIEREYSRAMNMLSSPKPWKRAYGRKILKALHATTHMGPYKFSPPASRQDYMAPSRQSLRPHAPGLRGFCLEASRASAAESPASAPRAFGLYSMLPRARG
ncbi:MAG: helix-turn-helix domain-containing protein [Nitrososphaerota archaeon]